LFNAEPTYKNLDMKILVVEDEKSLRDVIVESLEKERYVVEIASDFTEASYKVNDYDYDCVLLDITLPGGSGLDILRMLKSSKKNEGVIIISAKDSIDDKVAGLDLGADDYLAKPFHLAELHARVKSVIRRKQMDGNMLLQMGNLSLNPQTFHVEVAGKELSLNRKEYDLLYYFISNPNRVLNKTTLVEAVWGDYADQADSLDFVYSQVKNLRKKLVSIGADVELKAVYGFGYKLISKD
jgi:DNA-binding response OmpR family regulator